MEIEDQMTDQSENARVTEKLAAQAGRITELDKQVAVQREQMKTMQAEYKTDIARLAEDAAKRDKQQLLAIAGMLALAVAILGFLGN